MVIRVVQASKSPIQQMQTRNRVCCLCYTDLLGVGCRVASDRFTPFVTWSQKYLALFFHPSCVDKTWNITIESNPPQKPAQAVHMFPILVHQKTKLMLLDLRWNLHPLINNGLVKRRFDSSKVDVSVTACTINNRPLVFGTSICLCDEMDECKSSIKAVFKLRAVQWHNSATCCITHGTAPRPKYCMAAGSEPFNTSSHLWFLNLFGLTDWKSLSLSFRILSLHHSQKPFHSLLILWS